MVKEAAKVVPEMGYIGWDAFNGYQLSTVMLGNQIVGSPAVYDNMAVVGTDGTRIYGISIQ